KLGHSPTSGVITGQRNSTAARLRMARRSASLVCLTFPSVLPSLSVRGRFSDDVDERGAGVADDAGGDGGAGVGRASPPGGRGVPSGGGGHAAGAAGATSVAAELRSRGAPGGWGSVGHRGVGGAA